MVNLKFMICLSILECYVFQDCSQQGQSDCMCPLNSYSNARCHSSQGKACDLNKMACVKVCPTDNLAEEECLCGTTSYCKPGQSCKNNNCHTSCINDQIVSENCDCGSVACGVGALCKDDTCFSPCPNYDIAPEIGCICGTNNIFCNEGQMCRDGDCLFPSQTQVSVIFLIIGLFFVLTLSIVCFMLFFIV